MLIKPCLYWVPLPTVQELCQLQDKHATRPDVFDDVEEEQEIEILTQEISQVMLSEDNTSMAVCRPSLCVEDE